MTKKNPFRLKHIVLEDTKEVLVVCTSAITAMGISAMVKHSIIQDIPQR